MRFSTSWLLCLGLAVLHFPTDLSAQGSGIDDSTVVFGQSAAFFGPAAELGKELRLGLEAAFFEANANGGINGRRVRLVSIDDGYEPGRAIANTRELIEKKGVFALIGAVGTPTSRSAAPIAAEFGIPFVAPFTGADFLRNADKLPNVVNLRASYQQEINEMVERLITDRGITKIGILYQNDSFGRSGLQGLVSSLNSRGLELAASSTYSRNTTAVKTAVIDLRLDDPGGVVIVGAYKPAAAAIKWANEIGFNPVFFNISFVGSRALVRELGNDMKDVFMTQVMPDYLAEDIEIAVRYRQALTQMWPGAAMGFSSFEGYVAGRMALEALEGCGENPDRECFRRRFSDPEPMDLGGLILQFGGGDNQGLDLVFLTRLGNKRDFEPIGSIGVQEGAR